MQKFILTKIIDFFDYFHKKKIINFFKKFYNKNIDLIFDVGAHKGETIQLFCKNFKLKKIFSFEASPENFNELKKNIGKFKYKETKIVLENLALSSNEEKKIFKQANESSSSTLSDINYNSRYLKKKEKILDFFSKKSFFSEFEIQTTTLNNYIVKKKIDKIDILKIDTEGYEFPILKGMENQIEKVNFILFEHHYDDMIIKKYTFSDINKYLTDRNFSKAYKVKMPFRKTFEYIYINKKETNKLFLKKT